MKRLLLILFVFVSSIYAQCQQITSVAGCKFGETKENVLNVLGNRFGKYSYSDKGASVFLYDVSIGGITYKTAEFKFTYSSNGYVFSSATFYTLFPLNKLSDAKSMREYIYSIYKEKYEFTEGNYESLKYYHCQDALYEDNWILISVMKTENRNGDAKYSAGVSYHSMFERNEKDDI